MKVVFPQLNIHVFCDGMLCHQLSFQCFRVASHWKFEALCFFKTSGTVCPMIWCNIPENSILYQHHCENIKSGIIFSNPIKSTNMYYKVKYYNSLTCETEICCLHRRKLNMDLHKSLFFFHYDQPSLLSIGIVYNDVTDCSRHWRMFGWECLSNSQCSLPQHPWQLPLQHYHLSTKLHQRFRTQEVSFIA